MATTIEARAGAPQRRDSLRTVRIGLLGLGTVGQGLVRLLDRKGAEIEARHAVRFRVERVLVRDARKPREARPARAEVLDDPALFRAGEYDVVVEALGGTEPARTLVAEFLRRGVPVVTANKALLAEHEEALAALGAPLRGEAAVAAGIPLLSLLGDSLQTTAFHSLTAILNGTSNFVLTRMARDGLRLGAAVEEAGRLGFAEADPALDLAGTDAEQKLRLLARRLGHALAEVEVEGIGALEPGDCRRAAALGCVVKPIAHLREGRAFVAPACVPLDHPLARVDAEQNGVLLRGDTIPELFLAGPGAGGTPTAASVVDDLLALFARGDAGPRPPPRRRASKEPLRTAWLLSLRFSVEGAGTDAALDIVRPRESRLLRDAGLPELVAASAPLSRPELDRALASLRAVRSLASVRALRIVE